MSSSLNKTMADLLGHLHEIAVTQQRLASVHLRAEVYSYLLWRWQQKQALSKFEDTEITAQAITAFDECLQAELEGSESKAEASLNNLIKIFTS